MKSKAKTVAATLVLVIASVMSYYVLALAYMGIGGAIYSIGNGSFSAQDLGYLGLSLLMSAGFIGAYIVSVVYLCRQLYAIKKMDGRHSYHSFRTDCCSRNTADMGKFPI